MELINLLENYKSANLMEDAIEKIGVLCLFLIKSNK